MKTIVVWFRNDLRLADNPALHRAAEEADAVVPLFVWAPEEEGDWPPGAAHRWWLHGSLEALGGALHAKGSRLVLRRGPSLETLRAVAEAVGAEAIYWNRRYEPALRARDVRVAEGLREAGLRFAAFESYLLHDPARVETQSGGPYHVYTPFRRRLERVLDVPPPLPVPAMGASMSPARWPESEALEAFGLLPEIDWAGGLRDAWTPGESGARARLDAFVGDPLLAYGEGRDDLGADTTGRLSPHLHWGEVSPRTVWHRVQDWVANGVMRRTADRFLGEILWREFAYHMLYHYPSLPEAPLKEDFRHFPWRTAPERLRAWQQGRTGYPIVDAGMRELWATGWMHNRARLITASFLTKHLLVSWREGARWYWDTLVGGDLANNTINWQWVAGCGPDAQPFFRIFNPLAQAKRYDPDGAYVRRWLPELADLPAGHLHAPWEAPEGVLREAGVVLGGTYPRPIVDHREAREAALDAFEHVKAAAS